MKSIVSTIALGLLGAVEGGGLKVAVAVLCISAPFVRAQDGASPQAAPAQRVAAKAYATFLGNRAGEERDYEIAPGMKMTFCWCPEGEFSMGSPESEEFRKDDEYQVKVTFRRGFWMAKTEVTQAQWQAVMGNNPSYTKGEHLPVEMVSWIDAQKFLEKLNAHIGNADGAQMALPTEAQWEYSCRAGEKKPYSGGAVGEVAWNGENAGRQSHPVGTKKPNAWGLYDMHGNVYEWCADWYGSKLPGGVDPRGPDSGAHRICRGGSWYGKAYYCRSATRPSGPPSLLCGIHGFRVARSSGP